MNRNHLSHRSVLSLTGNDRQAFLQGLLTNDILSLTPGELRWTALLTVQGRIQCLFFVFCTSEALLLDLPSSQADTLHTLFKRFRLRADVQFSMTDLHVLTGPHHQTPPENSICYASDPRHPHMGWRAIMPPLPSEDDGKGDLAYLQRRLTLGIPDMIDFTPGQNLALEANLDFCHGVSWNKGCYLGQEVTARMHYRSQAKRRLLPVLLPEEVSFSSGENVQLNGHDVGELRTYHKGHGLAMLHHTAWAAESLSIAHQPVTLLWPDWLPTTLRPPTESSPS
ncbi:folate-binding protein [Saccharibacter sp. 17.LH.SD]|uniref:CAF17-like 4Fe-4S cluster assembly/insertion protein YgfZ n=1 Tax=Saccharibacter sp. 17.LH.SD TaxID=2689393 RepID=UPI00136A3F84|nr:folate-binding protein YgfZ [Saccharibacter sp. 17.LH.SD]MXV44494.1 folate-binding protein [Saccharibacter sp. 17.LH.SD]